MPPGALAFFAVAGGAAPVGACAPVPEYTNDVHGCGTFGQPEAQDCFPLDRRLEFTDCLASGGIWQCGSRADHLGEALVVIKTSANLGGVLCCRD